jgi:hypothetical protein
MKDSQDMGLLLDSRVPLIVIETHDEKRALDMLLRVANQRKKNVFRWSVTDGLARLSFGPEVAIANQRRLERHLHRFAAISRRCE